MRRFLFLFVCVLSLGAAHYVAYAQDPQYAVPLKCSYNISGSYGELRSNHYHAGVDMGTNGVEDVEVHAAEAGWVSRVKVGPYGYGRALYIDHPDGHTTVYGHLNGFAHKIDTLVRRVQYANKSFSIDVPVPKGHIVVARDEVVALSGNTGGSGGPHLHFEVRETESEEPLNPLRFVNAVRDVQPPVIYGVKMYALANDAQVAGACADKYFALNAIRGAEVSAAGTIGFGIHCTDYLAAGGRPCGVVEIRLFDNDSLLFRSRVDHFSFDLNKHVNSHIDMAERLGSKRYIQRCFVAPGNELPIYTVRKTPFDVAVGECHRIRIEVLDFAGNTSSVAFKVVGARRSSAAPRHAPVGYHIDRRRTWVKDTLGLDVMIPREALFEDAVVAISKENLPNGTAGFRIGDPASSLKKSFSLTLPVPEAWQSKGNKLYVAQGPSQSYVGGCMEGESFSGPQLRLTALCSSFGLYSVAFDDEPPTISIRNKSSVLRSSDVISIGVADRLTGVKNYDVFIDGQWQVFEYDYKKTRLKASVGYLGLAPGAHTLRVVVSDSCGNENDLTWKFSVAK